MNCFWSKLFCFELVAIHRVKMCADFVFNQLGVSSLNSSRLITSAHGKDEILPALGSDRLPHWIGTLALISNEDILMVFPPLFVKCHEYLYVVGHFNLVVSINLPLGQRRIELYEASFENTDACSADYHVTVEHEILTCSLVSGHNGYHVVPVIDLGDSVV